MGKRLFIDMDGTLARFHDQANYLERMYEEGFFSNLEPFKNMVDGIQLFMRRFPAVEVYIASSVLSGDAPYCEPDKHKWLDEYLPEIDVEHRLFTPMGQPKAKYVPGGVTKDDYLMDDYNKGLNQFLYDGGSAVKCHNNINQNGIGAHGGDAGSMWMGKMVHTDDKPEIIAAEMARHLGLDFELDMIGIVSPDTFSKSVSEFENPLNELRVLDGHTEFQEHTLKDSEGKYIIATEHEMRAVCFNFYKDEDFLAFLKEDSVQFAEDIKEARRAAELPIVGKIHYLSSKGTVVETGLHHTLEDMNKAVSELKDYGIPATVEWNIVLPKPDITKMNYFDLSDKLYYEFGLSDEQSDIVASALCLPLEKRTAEEMGTLLSFWLDHEAKLDIPLPDFLGMSLNSCKGYLVSAIKEKSVNKEYVSKKTGLDVLIKNAREVQRNTKNLTPHTAENVVRH